MDVNGLVLKMKSKKRTMACFSKEKRHLELLIGEPPKSSECFKLLSVGGGFSIMGIIKYVGCKEKINELYCSSFRIGKVQFEELCLMNKRGQIENCHFITSQTQKRVDTKIKKSGKTYNYFDYILDVCKKNNWKLTCCDNHTKICLMKTSNAYYVVETSSNLNENPKMEQFNFENDKKLFAWYKKLFEEIEKNL